MAIGNKQTVDNSMVRTWLRDRDPQANLLLDDFEFDDEEIHIARVITIDYYNETPPFTGRFNSSQIGSRYHLMMGICGQLMYMAANRFRRNELPMQAGGVSINDQGKAPQYDAAGDRLWSTYIRWVNTNKTAANVAQGWGTA